MIPSLFVSTILTPGLGLLRKIAPNIPASRNARVLMLAIAGQESNWSARVQSGNGAAHGHWQFERGGGVAGVLANPASKDAARAVCAAASIPADPVHAWGLMTTARGDPLAVCFARLLLWTDPRALPDAEDDEGCYETYIKNWRPGRPHPTSWAGCMQSAREALPDGGG